MKSYTHLPLNFAKKIIKLARRKWTVVEINKEIKISRKQINKCLELVCKEKRVLNLQGIGTGPRIIKTYTYKEYLNTISQREIDRKYKIAQHCEQAYPEFLAFCKFLYETKIVGVKVKRSAMEYIKEFKKTTLSENLISWESVEFIFWV